MGILLWSGRRPGKWPKSRGNTGLGPCRSRRRPRRPRASRRPGASRSRRWHVFRPRPYWKTLPCRAANWPTWSALSSKPPPSTLSGWAPSATWATATCIQTFLTDEKNTAEMARVEKAMAEIFDHAVALGGTITGEHGVGLAKNAFLPKAIGDASLETMRQLKRTLDPNNVLNPGKIFD